MPLFRTEPIDKVPYIEITRWKIFRVTSELWEEQTLHLCGYNLTEMHGRVSSAIIKFSSSSDGCIITTESGREYKLVGEPGYDPDAFYVWGIWCSRNQVKEFFDASEEYING